MVGFETTGSGLTVTVTVNGAPVQFVFGVRFSPTPIVPVGVTV